MAKLAAQAPELFRYFCPKARRLISIRANGKTLSRSAASSRWTHYREKRDNISLPEWTAIKQRYYNGLPSWARECKTLPSLNSLNRWARDEMVPTVTGDLVEPDGTGRDGAPSWLRALGFI